MSSTVALSTLGVGGTLVGAALGSVIITVGNAVYSHYFDRTGKLVKLKTVTLKKSDREALGLTGVVSDLEAPTVLRAADDPSTEVVGASGEEAVTQVSPVTQDADTTGVTEAIPAGTRAEGAGASTEGTTYETGPKWFRQKATVLRLAMVTAAAFGIFMVGITVFEQFSGQTLSATVRGDKEPGSGLTVLGGGGGGNRDQGEEEGGDQSNAPDPTSTPTPEETGEPTSGPTDQPDGDGSDSSDESDQERPDEPTPGPTNEPTPQPTTPTDPDDSDGGEGENTPAPAPTQQEPAPKTTPR